MRPPNAQEALSALLRGFHVRDDLSIPQTTDRFHLLAVRVPRNLHQQIHAIARRDGDTVAGIVRRMLRQGLDYRPVTK